MLIIILYLNKFNKNTNKNSYIDNIVLNLVVKLSFHPNNSPS